MPSKKDFLCKNFQIWINWKVQLIEGMWVCVFIYIFTLLCLCRDMCFFFTQTLEWLKYKDPCFLAPKPSPRELLPPVSQAPDVVSRLPPHHTGNDRRPGDDGVWGTGPLWERYLPRGSCLLNLWIPWAKFSDEANLNQFKIRTRARTLSPWAEGGKENNIESTDNPFTSLGPSPITTFLATTLDTAVNKERN